MGSGSRLSGDAAARVATALYRLEQGNFSNVKSVGKGVSEYKIDFGPGYRIYFGQEGNQLVILLGGGSKRHNKKILMSPRSSGPSTRIEKQKNKENIMPVTRKFRTTILNRAASDPKFRRQMLIEAVNELLTGDMEAGKAMLRDYINATISFPELAKKLKKTDKSVHRMLGPRGNPRAENILEIIKILQVNERVQLGVEVRKAAA